MSILKFCEVDNYYDCNREERNLAAIVFHLLLQKDRRGINEFLKNLGVGETRRIPESGWNEPDEFGIYFEYALLRDAWNRIKCLKDSDGTPLSEGEQNKRRRAIIRDLIGKEIWQALELDAKETNGEFNAVFNAARGDHSRIHSPASWTEFPNHKGALEEIKWAFNAKPDLVIHTSSREAVCFEFKLGSGIWSPRRGFTQLDVQWKIFEMLGIKSEFFLIQKKTQQQEKEESKFKKRTWAELFKHLLPPSEKAKLPRYIREAIASACKGCGEC